MINQTGESLRTINSFISNSTHGIALQKNIERSDSAKEVVLETGCGWPWQLLKVGYNFI